MSFHQHALIKRFFVVNTLSLFYASRDRRTTSTEVFIKRNSKKGFALTVNETFVFQALELSFKVTK